MKTWKASVDSPRVEPGRLSTECKTEIAGKLSMGEKCDKQERWKVIMANRAMVPMALQAFTEEVVRRKADLFRLAVLFGSHARGDDRDDSDVDVAVILSEMPASLIETKLALADIAYDVLLETGVLIQPMPLSMDEWDHPEHHRNPRLVNNIRREGRFL